MDSMTLQQVEKMGISEKRWLPERLKAPMASRDGGAGHAAGPEL